MSLLEPWHLSAIISAKVVHDLAAVDDFNRKAHGAVIDSVEVRVRNRDEIDLVRSISPRA